MFLAVASELFGAADVLSQAIAHDKGKPAARQGRKAVSLKERELLNESFPFLRLSGCRRQLEKAEVSVTVRIPAMARGQD